MTTGTKSSLFYLGGGHKPVLDQARGIYMWDQDGRRYLDGSSGAMVCNIGHGNENVLAAMQRQMKRFTFGYRTQFETEASEALATRLAGLCPDGHEKVFFVSGGSEAVESAMKLARQYAVTIGESNRWKVISRAPSYHGCTLGALAVTSYDPLTAPFVPMMQAMPKVPAPRAYLDGLDPNDPATGQFYADQLDAVIRSEGPGTVLAFLLEPIGGASTGALVPPQGYMQAVQDICQAHGVLLIMDEVMTGAARTGRFLGGDHWNMKPDIIAMSKGLGAGYVPLGAVIAHERVVEPVIKSGGFNHGFTYAGNPLASAAGLAVLDEIERLDLAGNAARMGLHLTNILTGLMDRHQIIGDVRGLGLLQAFEFMSDRQTKAPLPARMRAFDRFLQIAYGLGLIVYSRRTRQGLEGDHIIIAPPLIITKPQLDEIEVMLDEALCIFSKEIGA
ncbi:MAG: aspartate aminotransferase family protein [Rhodobacteraceae bacterium]|nr:MAG: aspartate aminotransferase family protein [Paracoccaceae bacterium]